MYLLLCRQISCFYRNTVKLAIITSTLILYSCNFLYISILFHGLFANCDCKCNENALLLNDIVMVYKELYLYAYITKDRPMWYAFS